MIAGLSLSTFLFLFLILLPGYVWAALAGRSRQEMRFDTALSQGLLVFCLSLGLLFLGDLLYGIEVCKGFLRVLLFLSGLAEEEVRSLAPAGIVFATVYFLAMAIGLAELVLAVVWDVLLWQRFRFWVRMRLVRLGRAVRALVCGVLTTMAGRGRIVPADCGRRKSFRLASGQVLGDVLLAYRLAGKRPFVAVALKNGQQLQGEVLRYGYGKGEALLIRDADRPDLAAWVPVGDITRLDFLNMNMLGQETEEKKQQREARLSKQDRILLDAILPGLADEIEEELRGFGSR
ncbi:hypothetical protein [Desulfovirgula thermocuniculi]|uniref:hypothetical protein n=1 Tax=Desulfovirgula thermocuniculi TaxID=348842 RepID=UPI0004888C1E|nr:hypothetical protein [Desulfovirgula thermocuniculi]